MNQVIHSGSLINNLIMQKVKAVEEPNIPSKMSSMTTDSEVPVVELNINKNFSDRLNKCFNKLSNFSSSDRLINYNIKASIRSKLDNVDKINIGDNKITIKFTDGVEWDYIVDNLTILFGSATDRDDKAKDFVSELNSIYQKRDWS